ncbi:hypothetical protein V8C86DRAFT_450771 [Haematococcus lacustris]
MAASAKRRKHALGIFLIFCTASIWIAGSFLAQHLMADGDGKRDAVPPFLLTYLATAIFTLYIPLVHGRQLLDDYLRARRPVYTRIAARSEEEGLRSPGAVPPEPRVAESRVRLAEARRQAISAAFWAAPLSFLAQYTFNVSLALTNVTSNTILSSTSSLFTFGLSVLLLSERFSARKLLCILACIAGTALVTCSDVEARPSSPPLSPSPAALPSLGLRSLAAQLSNSKGAHAGGAAAGGAALSLVFQQQHWQEQQEEQEGIRQLFSVEAFPPPAGSSAGGFHSPGSSPGSVSPSASGQGHAGSRGRLAVLGGDLLVVVSAALYACYTVVMKLKMPGEEEDVQVALFFGYMGLFTTVALAPVVVGMACWTTCCLTTCGLGP